MRQQTADKQIKDILKESHPGTAEAFSRAFKVRYWVSQTEYLNAISWIQVATDSVAN